MLFDISTAKKQILEKLVERDWTPTDLADELGHSTSTVYNHLEELANQGILTKETIPAKTRPKNQYSIGNGFIQYVTASPGQFREQTRRLDSHKESIVKIWNIPQPEFHPYLESYWYGLRNNVDITLETDIVAIAVYGSVARGDADDESDIDILVITETEPIERLIEEHVGTLRIDTPGQDTKMCLTEPFTRQDFRDALAYGSQFVDNILPELHAIYDPARMLTSPAETRRTFTRDNSSHGSERQ